MPSDNTQEASLPILPSELLSFISSPIPSVDALSSMERVSRINNYMTLKRDLKYPIPLEHLRHCYECMGAERASAMARARLEKATIKKATFTGPVDLDDLL